MILTIYNKIPIAISLKLRLDGRRRLVYVLLATIIVPIIIYWSLKTSCDFYSDTGGNNCDEIVILSGDILKIKGYNNMFFNGEYFSLTENEKFKTCVLDSGYTNTIHDNETGITRFEMEGLRISCGDTFIEFFQNQGAKYSELKYLEDAFLEAMGRSSFIEYGSMESNDIIGFEFNALTTILSKGIQFEEIDRLSADGLDLLNIGLKGEILNLIFKCHDCMSKQHNNGVSMKNFQKFIVTSTSLFILFNGFALIVVSIGLTDTATVESLTCDHDRIELSQQLVQTSE